MAISPYNQPASTQMYGPEWSGGITQQQPQLPIEPNPMDSYVSPYGSMFTGDVSKGDLKDLARLNVANFMGVAPQYTGFGGQYQGGAFGGTGFDVYGNVNVVDPNQGYQQRLSTLGSGLLNADPFQSMGPGALGYAQQGQQYGMQNMLAAQGQNPYYAQAAGALGGLLGQSNAQGVPQLGSGFAAGQAGVQGALSGTQGVGTLGQMGQDQFSGLAGFLAERERGQQQGLDARQLATGRLGSTGGAREQAALRSEQDRTAFQMAQNIEAQNAALQQQAYQQQMGQYAQQGALGGQLAGLGLAEGEFNLSGGLQQQAQRASIASALGGLGLQGQGQQFDIGRGMFGMGTDMYQQGIQNQLARQQLGMGMFGQMTEMQTMPYNVANQLAGIQSTRAGMNMMAPEMYANYLSGVQSSSSNRGTSGAGAAIGGAIGAMYGMGPVGAMAGDYAEREWF